MHRSVRWALVAASYLLVVACGSGGGAGPSGNGGVVPVITTTALLADLVKNVGGDRVRVTSVVPPGADIHSFQTTPDDSIVIGQARLVVSNGFGLDDFLEPVLGSAMGADTIHIIAAQGLDSMLAGENARDPHFWQNPVFVINYVQRIREALSNADPGHGPEYQANAEAYIEELRKVDQEVAAILGQVRPEFRHLVTYHDAFSHFAGRYGWDVSTFVASDADGVSPAAVVQVMGRVSDAQLPAVFVEPQFRSDVFQQAARDAGVVVETIYSDLSDDGPSSYIEMMQTNARSLAENLR